MKHVGYVLTAALVVLSLPVFADAVARRSAMSIWVESEDSVVLHRHRVNGDLVSESFVRVLDSRTGRTLSEFETAPFTTLVYVEGQYFAGLSDLKLGST